MMTSAAIRQAFLDFFSARGHQIVPSAPIVVKNDPTLMFTNAGMNQFKDYFLGNRQPPHPRVADTQKCLRVSGKHNDLEEVGVDTYHHTMFEMLGNWSFGDYFKQEAIAWSWELLTGVYGISPDRLYITVFEGDTADGLPADEEALAEWEKWIPADRILKGTKKDNFWEMGDTGPCGPCTEIHVDTRTEAERQSEDARQLVNAGHPQVIEIWNIVFIQFNRLRNGSLEQLPSRHVDTGMGFERLVRVLQQKQSNYDTDIFSDTIKKITEITGIVYGGGETSSDIAIRVNADHLRAICFTIADGQLPSNTGAGYVIRRILRRAVRYYYSYLNYHQPLLHQMVPVISEQFATVFPELKNQAAFVERVVHEEEESFLRTLGKGLRRIENIIASSAEMISGEEAFELNDTYGFPLDLTILIAQEKGLRVDEPGYEAARRRQQERARKAATVDTGDWNTLDEKAVSEFTGYDELSTVGRMIKYRRVKAKGKEVYQVVLDRTPFYAESGGQVGDTGILDFNGEEIAVTDTRKENELIIHITGRMPSNPEAEVKAVVDRERRISTAVHHSATHLLHAALRQVLGNHVTQKGSLVHPDYLRFDFSHFSKMTTEEIRRVEIMVNEKIRQNIPVVIRWMPREEALQSGAMALFGEKYGDRVRVVTMDPDYSIELCGGTHMGATGELGFFRITGETAVAAGVRRIEAVSGARAEEFSYGQSDLVQELGSLLKNPKDFARAVTAIQDENALLKKQLERLEHKQLAVLKEKLLKQVQQINGLSFIGEVVEAGSADALKKLAFDLRTHLEGYVIALAAAIEGRASMVLLLDEKVSKERSLDAAVIIRQQVAPLIRGGGGGQKTLATAGGQDISALHQVITTVKGLL